MQFIDEAKIFVKSGDGGPGCVSFRREANIPFGGPDGGDGGRGGSVIIESVSGLNTLIDFRYQQHFKAKKGEHGKGSNCSGKAADDLVIRVPVGTQIFGEDGESLLFDITLPNQRIILAKGGDGGQGNVHFKSATNQAPRRATPGWPGEERWVWLKLKLLSDAGLIGLPNAGKSTFLSRVTRAKPKIADYPFTTLKPQLGVVSVDGKEFVLADLPGLIEGAHQGVGLGIRFLKHVERCGVLLHLIDATQEDVVFAYHTVRNELLSYGNGLEEKKEIICLSKTDALLPEEVEEKKKALSEDIGLPVTTVSAVSGEGLTEILRELWSEIKEFRKANNLPGYIDDTQNPPEEEESQGEYSPI